MKSNDIVGLGNVMLDFSVYTDDNKLSELQLNKGELHLVDEEKAKKLLQNINYSEVAPGGSSANVIRAFAHFGGKAILYGKVGKDGHGDTYIQEMKNHGIISRICRDNIKTTGHCVSFITPDSERTFSTYLGAGLELKKEDILEEDIQNSQVLHLEAFQFEGSTKETLMHVMELAKKHNTLISIDLADPGVIRRNKDFFKEVVRNYADIVFVNENEAKEFTGLENENAAKEIGKHAKIAIVKLGKEGSLIYSNNEIIKIDSCPANCVDTTGAGDSYAAGFLYGYCNDWNIKDAGNLGSLLAAKVVEKVGVKIKELNAEELKQEIKPKLNQSELKIKETNKMVKIGIIGGSGLDNPDILKDAKDLEVDTPFGKPSSPLKTGNICGVDVVILARHGREHTIPPTQVNFRANIYALKEAGCTHILATTACGSLREEIARGHFVILDQFIDFTRHRKITFHEEFEPSKPVHTPMAEPFDKELRNVLVKSCQELNLTHHEKGTVITIEGPRFSTKAESHMFRSWGADVINMSVAPEAALANELGILYAAVAMSTDYDCWKEDEAPVTWKEILKVFRENVEKVTSLLVNTVAKIGGEIDLKKVIRTIPHWPKQGVMYRDITTLLENPKAFQYCIQKFVDEYKDKNITKVAGIESRGFIFGAALAKELNLPFIVIRKPGKLPGETISQEYELEYGTDKIEMHTDSISDGDNVLIVDDLIATGGTALAACQLVEKLGGKISGIAFAINLPDLKGAEKLTNYNVFSLVEFGGD